LDDLSSIVFVPYEPNRDREGPALMAIYKLAKSLLRSVMVRGLGLNDERAVLVGFAALCSRLDARGSALFRGIAAGTSSPATGPAAVGPIGWAPSSWALRAGPYGPRLCRWGRAEKPRGHVGYITRAVSPVNVPVLVPVPEIQGYSCLRRP